MGPGDGEGVDGAASLRSTLALVNDLPNGTLNPVAESVDVDVTENNCGTGTELMEIDAGTEIHIKLTSVIDQILKCL